MNPIKEAFDKIKQDIFSLKAEITLLRYELNNIKYENQQKFLQNNENQQTNTQTDTHSTNPTQNPTQNHPLSSTPTQNPTIQQSPEASISQNMTSSTGNRGVPTVNPTNSQTIQQSIQHWPNSPSYSVFSQEQPTHELNNDFEKAKELLDSLDSIKKDIRLKFKRLTPQEMQVFSTLYALQEQELEEITYKMLAKQLKLTESSIRDYTNRLISKGIPVLKIRQNNKKITLGISSDLQKIATLSTILKLREI